MEWTGAGVQRTCLAAAYLPANCGTAAVRTADLLRRHRAAEDRAGTDAKNEDSTGKAFGKRALLLSVDDAGRLVCVDGHRCPAAADCGCWMLSVPLADDCHAYNCRLELSAAGGAVELRTTTAVPPGQPLKMWFPPDLQLMLHVPFLTPVNIRDERKYVCHECGYACEKPNPLKIHLALDCGTSPRAKLWSRLAAAVDRGDEGHPAVAGARSFRFSLEPAARADPKPTRPSPTLRLQSSAFRPYSPAAADDSSASSASGCGPAMPPRSPPTPLPDGSLRNGPQHGDAATFFDRRCAEMETIVSNLGHSERGHLCIYCGKVYSRKYGLKIHIRTHTGFKPLKCKYCYRPFGDPSNLNKHVRLHAEGDTPYKCDCCGKILVRKRDLDRHMKSRHAHTIPKNLFKMHVPV